MIVEDKRDEQDLLDFDYEQWDENPPEPLSRDQTDNFREFIQNHICIRDQETRSQLQSDLVEHLWQLNGQS